MTTQVAFQPKEGGLIPTSSLQFLIEEITYKQAYKLVAKFHYLGNKRFIGQHCFGIIENGEVMGAVVYSPLAVPESAISFFGLPRGHYPDLVEMSRLVLNPKLNGTNAASRLVGRSLKELRKRGIKAVISYADSSRHLGIIYQASNFKYYGLTAQKSDFYYLDGRKHSRGKIQGEGMWLPRTRKHRYVFVFDKNLKVVLQEQKYPKQGDK